MSQLRDIKSVEHCTTVLRFCSDRMPGQLRVVDTTPANIPQRAVLPFQFDRHLRISHESLTLDIARLCARLLDRGGRVSCELCEKVGTPFRCLVRRIVLVQSNARLRRNSNGNGFKSTIVE